MFRFEETRHAIARNLYASSRICRLLARTLEAEKKVQCVSLQAESVRDRELVWTLEQKVTFASTMLTSFNAILLHALFGRLKNMIDFGSKL